MVKSANGIMIIKIETAMQQVIRLGLFFLRTRRIQNPQGRRNPLEVAQMAPIALYTTVISSAKMPTVTITKKMKLVFTTNILPYLFLTLIDLSFSIQQLVVFYEPFSGFSIAAKSKSLRVMKLLRLPKNMIGKVKQTDRRKLQLITKQMVVSVVT